jgi:hypothetical protein
MKHLPLTLIFIAFLWTASPVDQANAFPHFITALDENLHLVAGSTHMDAYQQANGGREARENGPLPPSRTAAMQLTSVDAVLSQDQQLFASTAAARNANMMSEGDVDEEGIPGNSLRRGGDERPSRIRRGAADANRQAGPRQDALALTVAERKLPDVTSNARVPSAALSTVSPLPGTMLHDASAEILKGRRFYTAMWETDNTVSKEEMHAVEGDVRRLTGSLASRPVEVTVFTVSECNGAFRLDWKTNAQSRTHRFEILRKIRKGWSVIGTVPGVIRDAEASWYSFIDPIQRGSESAIYQLRCLDETGWRSQSEILEITAGASKQNVVQNWPNPFNPSTNISFTLADCKHVQLSVSDVSGAVVAVLADKEFDKGSHTVRFDANDLPVGVYFYTLRTNDYTFTRRLVLTR